jgi:ParB family chromosome partitioning protein
MTTAKTTAKSGKGLGRGLSSLMGEAAVAEAQPVRAPAPAQQTTATKPRRGVETGDMSGAVQLPVSQLQPGKYQPRRHFDEEALPSLPTRSSGMG